jgi:hypothetical protein
MMTTLDYLTGETGFTSQIIGHVEQYDYPGCLELRWDIPNCGAVTEDTGIVLKSGYRFIVMSLLRNQLRYYAASEDVNEVDYEVGILPDARQAYLFAEDYLIYKRELLTILTPRNILRARLEAQGDHVIERLNTDVRDYRRPV